MCDADSRSDTESIGGECDPIFSGIRGHLGIPFVLLLLVVVLIWQRPLRRLFGFTAAAGAICAMLGARLRQACRNPIWSACSTAQVNVPPMPHPVSIPILLRRRTGAGPGVCPWTTTAGNASSV